MSRGKRIQDAYKEIDSKKYYSLADALNILKHYATNFQAKFDESVEMVCGLGVDPRHSDQMVRGMVAMPHGLGKDIKVAVFVKDERIDEAKGAGADVYGEDELIAQVKNGNINFDSCIATPDMMPKIGALGKILGPRGLMPNPKLGTVSNDIGAAVKQAKAGQVEFKVDKNGIVHTGVGKVNFSIEALKENILALYKSLLNAKPSASKGVYMKNIYLATSMGPSIKLDLASIEV